MIKILDSKHHLILGKGMGKKCHLGKNIKTLPVCRMNFLYLQLGASVYESSVQRSLHLHRSVPQMEVFRYDSHIYDDPVE